MPTGVVVRDNESFEQALRRFKRKCEKAGILSEVKRRRFYEKPSELRKRALIQARKKMLRKMFAQLQSFFEEYIEEKDRYREAIEKQYAPRLRQKEEELSQKMGQPVHIDINSDPEFVALVRKNLAALEDKYATVLAQVKGDLQTMCGDER